MSQNWWWEKEYFFEMRKEISHCQTYYNIRLKYCKYFHSFYKSILRQGEGIAVVVFWLLGVGAASVEAGVVVIEAGVVVVEAGDVVVVEAGAMFVEAIVEVVEAVAFMKALVGGMVFW